MNVDKRYGWRLALAHRCFCWTRAWIEIACSLTSILTLTYYRPGWDFEFLAWSAITEIKWRRDK